VAIWFPSLTTSPAPAFFNPTAVASNDGSCRCRLAVSDLVSWDWSFDHCHQWIRICASRVFSCLLSWMCRNPEHFKDSENLDSHPDAAISRAFLSIVRAHAEMNGEISWLAKPCSIMHSIFCHAIPEVSSWLGIITGTQTFSAAICLRILLRSRAHPVLSPYLEGSNQMRGCVVSTTLDCKR